MGEILTVEPFDQSSQNNDEFFMLMTESGQILESGLVSREVNISGMNDSILLVLNVFKTQLSELDKAIISLKKSQLTLPIAESDAERDMAFRGFVLYVQAYAHSLDAAHREAAHNLQVLIDNYGDFRRKAYNKQSADMINFLQDIDNSHTADIEEIEAGYWVDSMQDSNDKFINLMTNRYTEGVEQFSGEVREVRTQIGRSFRQMVSMLEAGNMVSEGTAYVKIINQLNERIRYYKNTVATRKGRAEAEEQKKKKREEGERI